jgi:hypothetical protein
MNLTTLGRPIGFGWGKLQLVTEFLWLDGMSTYGAVPAITRAAPGAFWPSLWHASRINRRSREFLQAGIAVHSLTSPFGLSWQSKKRQTEPGGLKMASFR